MKKERENKMMTEKVKESQKENQNDAKRKKTKKSQQKQDIMRQRAMKMRCIT